MNLIIIGPPGAGKGTQSNNIVNDFDLKQVSTGDLLRNEIKLQTDLGKKIESIINKGELASDDVVNVLIEKIISDPNNFNKLIASLPAIFILFCGSKVNSPDSISIPSDSNPLLTSPNNSGEVIII